MSSLSFIDLMFWKNILNCALDICREKKAIKRFFQMLNFFLLENLLEFARLSASKFLFISLMFFRTGNSFGDHPILNFLFLMLLHCEKGGHAPTQAKNMWR